MAETESSYKDYLVIVRYFENILQNTLKLIYSAVFRKEVLLGVQNPVWLQIYVYSKYIFATQSADYG